MKQSCFHLASEKVRRKFTLFSREYLYRLPRVRKIQKGEINNLISFFYSFIVNLSFFLLKQRKEEKDREAKEKENQVWFHSQFLLYD